MPSCSKWKRCAKKGRELRDFDDKASSCSSHFLRCQDCFLSRSHKMSCSNTTDGYGLILGVNPLCQLRFMSEAIGYEAGTKKGACNDHYDVSENNHLLFLGASLGKKGLQFLSRAWHTWFSHHLQSNENDDTSATNHHQTQNRKWSPTCWYPRALPRSIFK